MRMRLRPVLTASLVAGATAASVLSPVAGSAAPAPGAPSVSRLDNGSTRVVVPLPAPVGLRDAAPLVMSGDTALGYGRISADRRSVVIETRAKVGAVPSVRVAWSGGGVPAPRAGQASAARGTAPSGGAVIAPDARTVPPQALPGAVGDPGTPGPLGTARAQYSLGDTALQVPSGAKVEVTGEVTYPAPLATLPASPVIVLLHGRHDVCGRADGETAYEWPCAAGFRRIPSEQGYRGLADLLASHGNIVVSVAANGINATDGELADAGAQDRGFLVLHHLNLWRGWSGSELNGPFGAQFKDKLNLANVGLMGHSRGGEGVVAALAENRRTGSAYGIKAVVPLAPVDFNRHSVRGTPSMTLVPYCDGDVSDLQGVHFFDDATTGTVDAAPHALLGVLGANHNFFNTVWTPGGWEAGTSDDWWDPKDLFCGANTGRLTPAQQLAAGNAYIAAFLRARLQDQAGYDPLFHGNTATPASAAPAKTVAAWSAPAGSRLLVNDLRSNTANALGGATLATGFDASTLCGGTTRYALSCIQPRGSGGEPHLGQSWYAPDVPGLGQLHLVWSKAGPTWSNKVPAQYRDVAGYQHVTIRLTKDVWAFSATAPAVGLRLKDAAGTSRTVQLTGPAMNTPVFTGPTSSGRYGPVPHALVMTVPVPLTAYSGVDLRNLASISVVALGGSGDISIADISFQR